MLNHSRTLAYSDKENTSLSLSNGVGEVLFMG